VILALVVLCIPAPATSSRDPSPHSKHCLRVSSPLSLSRRTFFLSFECPPPPRTDILSEIILIEVSLLSRNGADGLAEGYSPSSFVALFSWPMLLLRRVFFCLLRDSSLLRDCPLPQNPPLPPRGSTHSIAARILLVWFPIFPRAPQDAA